MIEDCVYHSLTGQINISSVEVEQSLIVVESDRRLLDSAYFVSITFAV